MATDFTWLTADHTTASAERRGEEAGDYNLTQPFAIIMSAAEVVIVEGTATRLRSLLHNALEQLNNLSAPLVEAPTSTTTDEGKQVTGAEVSASRGRVRSGISATNGRGKSGWPWHLASLGKPATTGYQICGHHHRTWTAAADCARKLWPIEPNQKSTAPDALYQHVGDNHGDQ